MVGLDAITTAGASESDKMYALPLTLASGVLHPVIAAPAAQNIVAARARRADIITTYTNGGPSSSLKSGIEDCELPRTPQSLVL